MIPRNMPRQPLNLGRIHDRALQDSAGEISWKGYRQLGLHSFCQSWTVASWILDCTTRTSLKVIGQDLAWSREYLDNHAPPDVGRHHGERVADWAHLHSDALTVAGVLQDTET